MVSALLEDRHGTIWAGTSVTVEIRYDRQCRLWVRDDGTGIDEKVLEGSRRVGHFGLQGRRERAVGGRLELWSKTGYGTRVELSIPGARAYASPRRSILGRLLVWHGMRRGARDHER